MNEQGVISRLEALGLRGDSVMTVEGQGGRLQAVGLQGGLLRLQRLPLAFEGAGAASFPVNALASALRLGGEDIRLRFDGDALRFEAPGLSGYLGDHDTARGAPRGPDLSEALAEGQTVATVDAGALAEALGAAWACGPQARRGAAVSSRLRLTMAAGRLEALACDGDLLARVVRPGGDGTFAALVPGAAAVALARSLKDTAGTVTVSVSRTGWLRVEAGELTLCTLGQPELTGTEAWGSVPERAQAPVGDLPRAALLARLRDLRGQDARVAIEARGGALHVGGVATGTAVGEDTAFTVDRQGLKRAAEGCARHGDTLRLFHGEGTLRIEGRSTAVMGCRPV